MSLILFVLLCSTLAPRSDAHVEETGAEVRSQVVRCAENHEHEARARPK